MTEVETLPRDKVLNFLTEGFRDLAIPYLEHIIYMWDEKGPAFHNVLIQLYLEKVQTLMKEYLNSLPEGKSKRKILKLIKLHSFCEHLDNSTASYPNSDLSLEILRDMSVKAELQGNATPGSFNTFLTKSLYHF